MGSMYGAFKCVQRRQQEQAAVWKMTLCHVCFHPAPPPPLGDLSFKGYKIRQSKVISFLLFFFLLYLPWLSFLDNTGFENSYTIPVHPQELWIFIKLPPS